MYKYLSICVCIYMYILCVCMYIVCMFVGLCMCVCMPTMHAIDPPACTHSVVVFHCHMNHDRPQHWDLFVSYSLYA